MIRRILRVILSRAPTRRRNNTDTHTHTHTHTHTYTHTNTHREVCVGRRGQLLLAPCQAAAPACLPAAAPVHRARALLLLFHGEVHCLAAARLRRGSGGVGEADLRSLSHPNMFACPVLLVWKNRRCGSVAMSSVLGRQRTVSDPSHFAHLHSCQGSSTSTALQPHHARAPLVPLPLLLLDDMRPQRGGRRLLAVAAHVVLAGLVHPEELVHDR